MIKDKTAVAVRKKWISENWDQIKFCLPEQVYNKMLVSGIFCKKTHPKTVMSSIEMFINNERKNRK